MVGLIGASALFQYLSGISLGIDTLLLFDRTWGRAGTLAIGRMGPPASVSWTLAGAALILLPGGAGKRRAAAALGVAITCIASLSLAGYLFGADPLYSIPRLTTIAVQTSSILLAVGVGLIAAVPDRQPMRGLLEDSAAGVLTRRILPFIIFIPAILGRLRVWGQDAGLYDTAMGTAVLVLGLIGFLCGLLWWSAGAVRGYERATSALNARLRTSVRELEAVFSAAPVGIAVSRDRDCREVVVNAAFTRLLGIRRQRGSLDEGGHEIPGPELPLQVAARTGEGVFGRVLVLERADGERLVLVGSRRSRRPRAGRIRGRDRGVRERDRRTARGRGTGSAPRDGGAGAGGGGDRESRQGRVPGRALARAPLPAQRDAGLGAASCRKSAPGNAMRRPRGGDARAEHLGPRRRSSTTCSTSRGSSAGKFQLERSRVDLAAAGRRGSPSPCGPLATGKRLALEVAASPIGGWTSTAMPAAWSR